MLSSLLIRPSFHHPDAMYKYMCISIGSTFVLLKTKRNTNMNRIRNTYVPAPSDTTDVKNDFREFELFLFCSVAWPILKSTGENCECVLWFMALCILMFDSDEFPYGFSSATRFQANNNKYYAMNTRTENSIALCFLLWRGAWMSYRVYDRQSNNGKMPCGRGKLLFFPLIFREHLGKYTRAAYRMLGQWPK